LEIEPIDDQEEEPEVDELKSDDGMYITDPLQLPPESTVDTDSDGVNKPPECIPMLSPSGDVDGGDMSLFSNLELYGPLPIAGPDSWPGFYPACRSD
jgi:hypothetical protein